MPIPSEFFPVTEGDCLDIYDCITPGEETVLSFIGILFGNNRETIISLN